MMRAVAWQAVALSVSSLLFPHTSSAQDIGFVAVPKVAVGTTNVGPVGAISSSGLLGSVTPTALDGFVATDLAVSGGQIVAVGTAATGRAALIRLSVSSSFDDGTFGLPQVIGLPQVPRGIAIADINLDGTDDVVVAEGPVDAGSVETASRLLLLDLAAFEQAPEGALLLVPFITVKNGTPVSLSFAHLNDDPFPDLVVAVSGTPGRVLVVLSDATTGLSGQGAQVLTLQTLGAIAPSMPRAITAGAGNNSDIEGQPADADEDLFVATSAGVEMYTNRLATLGGFSFVGLLQGGSGPSGIALADLNGDGIPDVVTTNSGNGTITSNLANGGSSGGYGAGHTTVIGGHPVVFATLQADDDGIPDLVVPEAAVDGGADGRVRVLRGLATGAFEPAFGLDAGSTPRGLPIRNPIGVATGSLDARSRHEADIVLIDGGGAGQPPGVAFLSAAAGYDIVEACGASCVPENHAPAVDAGPNQTLTATSPLGAPVVLAASGVDPDRDSMTFVWTEGATVLGTGEQITVTRSIGVHQITVTADDGRGGTASSSTEVTVVAGTPRISVRVARARTESGTTRSVTLRFVNVGDGLARHLRVTELDATVLDSPGKSKGKARIVWPDVPLALGDLDPGESRTVRILIHVPAHANKLRITEDTTFKDVLGAKLRFHDRQVVVFPDPPRHPHRPPHK